MHDELNRVKSKPKYRELDFGNNMPIEQQSQEWSQYYKARDDSIMTDLFEGQLINRTKCLSCGFTDCAFDNFMDLSVEIPRKRFSGSVKLTDCIEKFIEPERMIDTGFKCSSCKRKVDIEKDLTIYQFPQLLVIHLKRFSNTGMRREKLSTSIQFAETLDVSGFAPHSSKFTSFFADSQCLLFLENRSKWLRDMELFCLMPLWLFFSRSAPIL